MRFDTPGLRSALLIPALAGTLATCRSGPLLPEADNEIVIDFDGAHEWPTDDWDLQDVRLEDGALEITTAYAGGCRTHVFWLVAVNGWQMLPDAGPVPRVAVPTLLAHDANGDRCEARITRVLAFALDPLIRAYRNDFGTGPATILLRIPRGQGADDTTTVDVPVTAVAPLDTSP